MIGAAENPPAAHLPPQSVWLIDPARGKFETPVDEMGLIKIDPLIRLVKSTIDPSYEWPLEPRAPNTHHFYWYDALYPSRIRDEVTHREQSSNLHIFRELPVHRGKMPRQFHDWLHEITVPPEVPNLDVVDYRIEAWDVARTLFRRLNIQRAKIKRRHKRAYKDEATLLDDETIDQMMIDQIAKDNFPHWYKNMERLEKVPREIRLIQPTEKPQVIFKRLKKFAVMKELSLVPVVLST